MSCAFHGWKRRRHSENRKLFRRNRLSYRLACERLEVRWLLAAPSITRVEPAAESHVAPPDATLAIVFDQAVLPASVTDRSIRVHTAETAAGRDPATTLQVDGPKISVTPSRSFHPGETVQVTATSGIQGLDGEVAEGGVWQFRVGVGIGNGRGSGFFRDSGQVLGDAESTGVALGDLDGDGDLDAFIVNGGQFSAEPDRVWLNDGAGNFRDSGQELGIASGLAVALGDLDGDGDLDAFVGNGGSGSPRNNNRVWLNDGQGNFTNSQQRLGSDSTQSVALADLDGDGDLDALTGNQSRGDSPANRVWLNDGHGNFRSGQGLGNRDTNSVALGDLDGDGDVDAFVANGDSLFAALPNEVWLNNGDATFSNSGQELGAANSADVALGDVDNDGDLDAFVVNKVDSVLPVQPPSRVWLNDGSGRFQKSGQELEATLVGGVALGDLDGDGDLDAFVGNILPRPDHVWINDGSGRFTDSGQQLGVNAIRGNLTRDVALGDLDGDGDLDALAAQSFSGWPELRGNWVWINADMGADLSIAVSNGQTEAEVGQSVTYTIRATNEGPEAIAGVTVTDDFPAQLGDIRWKCAAGEDSTCTVSGQGHIDDTVTLAAGGSVTYLATGTVLPEASAVSAITNRATITAPPGLQLLSDSTVWAEDVDVVLPVVNVEPRPNSLGAAVDADVSATFRDDVDPSSLSFDSFSVRAAQSGPLTAPRDNLQADVSTVTATAARPFLPGELVEVTATPDIRFQNSQPQTSPIVWQFRTAVGRGAGVGSGIMADTFQSLGSLSTQAVGLADLDGDGDLDALLAHGREYAPLPNSIWWNDGAGGFRDSGQQLGNSPSTAVALGDLDGDGDVDAWVGNRGNSDDQVWLNDGHGTFVAGQALESTNTWSVALGDLDGDGDLDALVGSRGADSVWLNDGTANFVRTDQPFPSDPLRPNSTSSVALGDLDGDGDLDAMLAANEYQPEQSMWLNDGFGRFVDSGQRLGSSPSMSVVLGDVDGDGDLDAVFGRTTDLYANPVDVSYGNTVWLNDGRGQFTDSGQRLGDASSMDLELGDLDGDGDLDLLAGNMYYAPWPGYLEIDPLPNTVWLNDGSGNFAVSDQRMSAGLTYDVVLGDLDGDGDLDVLEGGVDTSRIWLNADQSGADLSVSLSNGTKALQPGAPLQYSVIVANDGPDDVQGAALAVRLDPQIAGATWTCTVSEGGTCGLTGTGDILETITVPAGGQITYAITGVLAPTANRTIEVTGEVATPSEVTDLDPRNNRVVDRDVITPLRSTPAPNSNVAAVSGEIALTYNRPLEPPTVTEQTVTVHAMQSGRWMVPPNVPSVDGNTITVMPEQALHPGELVSVSATQGIENADGQGPISPYIMQFRAAVGQGNGKGSGTFVPAGRILSENWHRQSTLADMDGDGDLDAIVGDQLWLNDGQGELRKSGQSETEASGVVAVGDLDVDGDLDLIVGGSVYLNDGAGVLQDVGRRVDETEIQSMALGDVDGDGDLDVVVGRRVYSVSPYFDAPAIAGAPTKIWLNDGHANFQDSGQELTSAYTRSVALGDLDRDGDLDLVIGVSRVHSRQGGADRVWLNDGEGIFHDTGQMLGDADTFQLVLGDVDGDGDLDLVTGNADYTFETEATGPVSNPAPNRVWLNDGAGTFSDTGQRLGNGFTQGAALGDVDGDGDLDALFADSGQSVDAPDVPGPDQVWLNDGQGNFAEGERPLGDSESYGLALGDLDGDGDLDAIVAGGREGSEIWLNVDAHPSDLAVTLTSGQRVVLPGQSVRYTLTVTNHGPEPVVGALLTTRLAPELDDVTWGCTATAGAACSPEGSGDISDLVALANSASVIYSIQGMVQAAANVMLVSRATISPPQSVTDVDTSNNTARDEDFIPPQSFDPEPNTHTHAVSEPVTVTSRQEILPASVDADSLVVHRAQSGRLTESESVFTVTGETISVTAGPPFHPGELVSVTLTENVENLDGQGSVAPYVWQFRAAVGTGNRRGSATFTDTGQELIGSESAEDVALGDFDGDGDLDAIAGRAPKLWLNDGQGGFRDSGQTLGTRGGNGIEIADLDADGDLDVVTSAGGAIWLNDGQGAFRQSSQRLGEGYVDGIALGDLDNDGDIDAIVLDDSPDRVWLNDGLARFTPGDSFEAYTRQPMALGDLDGDRDLDAVIADQIWLNDGSGGFSDTGQELFGFAPFSAVRLGDIDGDGDLDILTTASQAGSQHNLTHVNDGTGQFRSGFGSLGGLGKSDMVLGDLDGDGDLDVLGVAGLLIEAWINDGRGVFAEAEQDIGNTFARSVAVGDLDGDGDLDLVIGNYRESGRVWLNESSEDAQWDGDAPVGVPGDGVRWDDANNWSVNGQADVAPSDSADVIFRRAPAQGPVQLGGPQTVQSLTFEADVTLQGGSLAVSSGQFRVAPSVTATIGSDIEGSGVEDLMKKLGGGTLVLAGDALYIRVDSGTLTVDGTARHIWAPAGTVAGMGQIEWVVVDEAATLAVGLEPQAMSVTQATILGRLLSQVGNLSETPTAQLEVESNLSLWSDSALEVRASAPLGSVGSHTRKIIGADRISGRFGAQPNPGDHVGSGVFVAEAGVTYEPSGISISLYQAAPGDANGDHQFNQRDLQQVMAARTYLTTEAADWTEGDWNGDGYFDTKDIVFVLMRGNFG